MTSADHDGKFIPYGRQEIGADDIQAVTDVLRSDWLTTGPKIGEFEKAFATFVGAKHAVAVCNGTAALHAAVAAAGIAPGDEVVVSAMTFAASSNAVIYQGATPIFADVDPKTLLIDPASVVKKITPRTRAIVAVDYAGQTCDYDALQKIAKEHRLKIIADACHALGATDHGRRVGELADLTAYSFHPVKHITTGEGGMITTHSEELATRLRCFRNHGITTDHRQRSETGAWFYEMQDLGYNYRLTDIQAALGLSQLRKLPAWLDRRRAIARQYDHALSGWTELRPLGRRVGTEHAYHLYVVTLESHQKDARERLYRHMREQGIGVNVHYIPVHLHPYYRKRFGTGPGLCPIAEERYEKILSLPMYPAMTDEDVKRVVDTLRHGLETLRA